MARRVFFSFHYDPDNWRASQVRMMGAIEGNPPVSDNDWETITRGGAPNIEKWIKGQLEGKSCTVVLIGSDTAGRKWINYEIEQSWNSQKGLLGIYIHNLKGKDGKQTSKGANPFSGFRYGQQTPLTNAVKTYDPPFTDSTKVYEYIKTNLVQWVEDAIATRARIGR